MLEVRLKGFSWYFINYLNVYIFFGRMFFNLFFLLEFMYKLNWIDLCVLSKWFVILVYGVIFVNIGFIVGIRKWIVFEFVRLIKFSFF